MNCRNKYVYMEKQILETTGTKQFIRTNKLYEPTEQICILVE
jgi:hypothetical protein